VSDSEQPRYPVRLRGVPTDLLLAAKAHVENLVREFTLAAAGAATGRTAAVPRHLTRLIERVVTEFAEPSQMIKRQAVAAASHGDSRTDLVLYLPASAGDAGLRYLAALDEADAYARASRLLTLETPPQQRVFRRWYVEAIVAQLRSAALGEPAAPIQPFEERVLDELGTVTLAQRETSRTARLQTVTAGLAAAATAEQVADVVVSQSVAALGASGGGLLLPADADRFEVPGAVGYGDALLERLRLQSRHAELPAAVALRTGRAVWIESREERDALYPELAGLEPRTMSVCAVPLTAGTHVWG
nr:hypothetical protein [Micromonospora sp. DSM 115978]